MIISVSLNSFDITIKNYVDYTTRFVCLFMSVRIKHLDDTVYYIFSMFGAAFLDLFFVLC